MFPMSLQRGEVKGYDFNRMAVEFTMLNQGKIILCAISTATMDDLEGRRDLKAEQRVEQFMRLREVIEERASRSFSKSRLRPTDPSCCDPTISSNNRFERRADQLGCAADILPNGLPVPGTSKKVEANFRSTHPITS